jgi:hypothetical protein
MKAKPVVERGLVNMSASWSRLDKKRFSIYSLGGNHIMNKVEVNFHVFCTSVEHRIGR